MPQSKKSFRLSPSKYVTYDMCPLKFQYQYIDQEPTEPSPHLELGNVIHNTIEELEELEEVTERIALKYLNKNLKATDLIKSKKEFKDRAKKMLKKYLEWSKENTDNATVDVEVWFDLKRPTHIKGRIDRVEETPKGNIEIIDYKTGKTSLNKKTIRKDIQMNMYAIGAKKLYRKTPTAASVLYLKTGRMVRYNITNKSLEVFRKRLDKMTKSINKSIKNNDFKAKPGYWCRFCDYADICEYNPY